MNIPQFRSSFSRASLATLLALGGLVAFATTARADDTATLQRLAAGKAPLTAKFDKKATTDSAPYSLTLTNTSADTLKVSIKVLLSVAFHADNKARNIAEQPIAAGKSVSISDLAAGDKITVTVAGYDALQLVVP
ncbi:MAG TPA: hypothetical protein VHD32_08300 [Candidatus Didemnitutus sp.]|nr:hypothetical protein [Candidatus Didemnitutus sp.]